MGAVMTFFQTPVGRWRIQRGPLPRFSSLVDFLTRNEVAMIEVVEHRVIVNPHVVAEADLEDSLPKSRSGNSYLLDADLFEEYQRELKVAAASVEARQEELGYDTDENPFWDMVFQTRFQNSAESKADALLQMQGSSPLTKTVTFNSLTQMQNFEMGEKIEGLKIEATDETWSNEAGDSGQVNQIVKPGESQSIAQETQEETPQPAEPQNEQPAEQPNQPQNQAA